MTKLLLQFLKSSAAPAAAAAAATDQGRILAATHGCLRFTAGSEPSLTLLRLVVQLDVVSRADLFRTLHQSPQWRWTVIEKAGN